MKHIVSFEIETDASGMRIQSMIVPYVDLPTEVGLHDIVLRYLQAFRDRSVGRFNFAGKGPTPEHKSSPISDRSTAMPRAKPAARKTASSTRKSAAPTAKKRASTAKKTTAKKR